MLPVAASFQGTARYLMGDQYPRLEPALSTAEAAAPRTRPIVGPRGELFTLKDNLLTARHPDGTHHWSKTVPGELQPPLVDGKGNLYLTSKEGKITSLDARGETRWETQLEGQVYKPATLAGDDTLGLVATGGPGVIYNLDAENGSQRFRRPLMGQIIISGFYGGPEGNLYLFNGNEHKLSCYEPNGRSPWSHGVADLMGPPAFGADGTIYIPRPFGDVKAVDPKTGQQLWSYRPGKSRPEVNEQLVVRSDKTVMRLDPRTGDPQWSRELPQTAQGAPVSDGNGHTFVNAEDTVYAVTTTGGQPQASFQPCGPLAPLAEGALVSDSQGTVHHLSLGAEQLHQAENQPNGQIVAEAGRVLVGGVALPVRRS